MSKPYTSYDNIIAKVINCHNIYLNTYQTSGQTGGNECSIIQLVTKFKAFGRSKVASDKHVGIDTQDHQRQSCSYQVSVG